MPLFLLLKSTGVVSNLLISNQSTSDFKQAKSAFLADLDLLMPIALFQSDFALLGKSNSTFVIFLLRLYVSGK